MKKVKAQLVPDDSSQNWNWKFWVFSDECPDDEYRDMPIGKPDENGIQTFVGGSCFDDGLDEGPCPHMRRMETDEHSVLWVTCDSEGWNA